MAEIWKNIPGIDACYFVSNLGNFKSVGRMENGARRITKRKDKILKPSIDSSGYLNVRFMIDGKQKSFLAHRIVANVFIDNIDCKDFVNHINGIKIDNRVENLEWCTASENNKHAFEIGLQNNKGTNHPTHKLTDSQVLEIREKYKPRVYSSYRLAKEYGVGRVTINDIINRKTWAHI